MNSLHGDWGDGVLGPSEVQYSRAFVNVPRRCDARRDDGLGALLPAGANLVATLHSNARRECTAVPEDLVEGLGRVRQQLRMVESKVAAVGPELGMSALGACGEALVEDCDIIATNLRVLADEIDRLARTLPAGGPVVVDPEELLHGFRLVANTLDEVQNRVFIETLTTRDCITAADNFRGLAAQLSAMIPALVATGRTDQLTDDAPER